MKLNQLRQIIEPVVDISAPVTKLADELRLGLTLTFLQSIPKGPNEKSLGSALRDQSYLRGQTVLVARDMPEDLPKKVSFLFGFGVHRDLNTASTVGVKWGLQSVCGRVYCISDLRERGYRPMRILCATWTQDLNGWPVLPLMFSQHLDR